VRSFSELTARELEAFKYLAEGKRDADVAQILGVGVAQVRHLVWHGCIRLGAETRAQAVAMLAKSGKL
jgi:DNA-binding CsgD family transcriptional regulator